MERVKTKKDKFSGKFPNIHWKSISNSWKENTYRLRKDVDEYSEQGSDAWLSLREKTVCASELCNLFGFWSKYGSKVYGKVTDTKPRDVPDEKDINMRRSYEKICYVFKRLHQEGEIVDVPAHIERCEPVKNESNAAMDWGKIHEINALKIIHDVTDFIIAESGLKRSKEELEIGDRKIPLYIGASPDGLINTDLVDGKREHAVLEIKCSSPFIQTDDGYKYRKRTKWSKFPYYYVSQVQLQMHQTGRKNAYLVNYTPTDGVKIMKMDYSKEYMDLVLEMIKLFAKYVWENPTPPPEDFWKTYPNYEKYMELNHQIVESIQNVKDIGNTDVDNYLKPYYVQLSTSEVFLDDIMGINNQG